MSEASAVIGIAAIAGVAFIVVGMWITYWVYRTKLLEREERRLMIERGLTPPPPAAAGWPAVKARELELAHEERRLRIEKGLPIPPDPPARPSDPLRRGLVTLALGLGAAAGAYVYFVFGRTVGTPSVDERNWFLFFAVISPVLVLYGLANVIHSRMKREPRSAGVPGPDPVP